MFGSDWAWLVLSAILNAAIGYVFLKLLSAVSIKDVVSEKSQDVAPGSQGESSSSRVIGFMGGMIMACFVWAVANIIVYLGLKNPTAVSGFVGSIGGFLLSGSALFLPYAVNRLSDVGKAATQSSAADKDKAATGDAPKKAEADLKARTDEANKVAAQQIDAAISQQQLTAEATRSIVADAIKKATGVN
jgi:hypothetical protein